MSDLNQVWTEAGNLTNISYHPSKPEKRVVYDDCRIHAIGDCGGMYKCDKLCVQYREHDSFFCRHTLTVVEAEHHLQNFLPLVNAEISRESSKLLNDAIGNTCRGAGHKGTKRKGSNNKLSSDIKTTSAAQGGIHPLTDSSLCALLELHHSTSTTSCLYNL